jgi:WD40 repeat protein
MSAAGDPDFLLASRGVQRTLDAFVVSACFDRASKYAAFALGDGSVHLVRLAERERWQRIEAHNGAVMALSPDCIPESFISGGDDGLFRRLGVDGALQTVAEYPGKWVEHVASFRGEKAKGYIACAVGRDVHLFNAEGVLLKSLSHPSTVADFVFDARGKRVAVARYNGASLWFVAAKADSPRQLEWKGSHIRIAISPDGDSVITAMQENALHGWRLSDGQHMRMSGYPKKTQSLAFTHNGRWLATSGADAIVLWPFFGGGPMGKRPMELAGGDGIVCTMVAAPGRGPISALSWSENGANLAFGTETGFAAIVDFSKR